MIHIENTSVTVKDILDEIKATPNATQLCINNSVVDDDLDEVLERLPDHINTLVLDTVKSDSMIDLSKLKNKTKLTSLTIKNDHVHNEEHLPPSLKSLTLYRCKMTRLQFLSRLSELEYLDVSYNLLRNKLSNEDIAAIPKLRTLILKRNSIGDSNTITRVLQRIPTLKVLDLDGNDMHGSIDVESIVNHSSIELIYLRDTFMTKGEEHDKIVYTEASNYESKRLFYSIDGKTRVVVSKDKGRILAVIGGALQLVSDTENTEHIHNASLILKDVIASLVDEGIVHVIKTVISELSKS